MDYMPNVDKNIFELDTKNFLPSVSVDCIILGFHNKNVKILLNKFDYINDWMLPGGFVFKNENVDDAAYRILHSRTGLTCNFLRQFFTFGDCNRVPYQENSEILKSKNDKHTSDHWFLNRFISVGYFALVDYSQVEVKVEDTADQVKWFALDEIPQLYADHNKIIDKAFQTLRQQIDYIPFGYELLPNKFTMSELRIIYETILGRPLDRRNFQRKMLSINFIEKLDEVTTKRNRRPTTLFTFNKERYIEAIKNGASFTNW